MADLGPAAVPALHCTTTWCDFSNSIVELDKTAHNNRPPASRFLTSSPYTKTQRKKRQAPRGACASMSPFGEPRNSYSRSSTLGFIDRGGTCRSQKSGRSQSPDRYHARVGVAFRKYAQSRWSYQNSFIDEGSIHVRGRSGRAFFLNRPVLGMI